MKHLLEQIHELELSVPLDLDAILHKATQEHGEFIESIGQWDPEHLTDEASDVIANVLSVSHRIWLDLDQRETQTTQLLPANLTPLFSKRNDQVQTLRNIYTRHDKHVSLAQLTASTQSYISGVLGQLDPTTTLTDLLQHSIHKMSGRMEMYASPINLADYVINVPDYPLPGIQFKDITTLCADPAAFKLTIDKLSALSQDAEVIVWLDARGFIFWSTVAYKLWIPFVPVRKPGKLPRETLDISYDLEYGSNALAIHTDAIHAGQKVVIIDDLLATGWSATAAKQLITWLGGEVIWANFVIELDALWGKTKLWDTLVTSLIHYA